MGIIFLKVLFVICSIALGFSVAMAIMTGNKKEGSKTEARPKTRSEKVSKKVDKGIKKALFKQEKLAEYMKYKQAIDWLIEKGNK
jgi:hypothetical protein